MTMPWLHPLCEKIREQKAFSMDQRDTLILWAAELAGICARWVPLASSPQLEGFDDEGELHLAWSRPMLERSLRVIVDEKNEVCLNLYDRGVVQNDPRPTHERLKVAVQCFFSGWSPSNTGTTP